MVQGLTTGTPKPLYRRTLPGAGKPGFAPQVEWAKLLSGSHVAAIVDRVLHVWDLPAAKLVYRVETVSASEPPVFSGNQLYMAIPQSGKVVIVETATGTVRKSIATGSTLTPGAAFDPVVAGWRSASRISIRSGTGGRQASSAKPRPRTIWGRTRSSGSAPSCSAGRWATPSIWTWECRSGNTTTSASTEPILVGDKFADGDDLAELCVGQRVDPACLGREIGRRSCMRAGDAAMLVRAGSAVAIAVEAAGRWIKRRSRRRWRRPRRKPVGRSATAARSPWLPRSAAARPEQLQFRSMRGGPNTVSTASLTPFTAELEIRSGNDVLWTRSTENRIPPLLQSAGRRNGPGRQIRRYEKPDAGFFCATEPAAPHSQTGDHRADWNEQSEGRQVRQDMTVNRKAFTVVRRPTVERNDARYSPRVLIPNDTQAGPLLATKHVQVAVAVQVEQLQTVEFDPFRPADLAHAARRPRGGTCRRPASGHPTCPPVALSQLNTRSIRPSPSRSPAATPLPVPQPAGSGTSTCCQVCSRSAGAKNSDSPRSLMAQAMSVRPSPSRSAVVRNIASRSAAPMRCSRSTLPRPAPWLRCRDAPARARRVFFPCGGR